jgi:hypothetical protein
VALAWLRRLARTRQDLDAEELRAGIHEHGATPVAGCVAGEPATVAGMLRSVTVRPRSGVPALEAELFDGTGTLTLVWLGRRRIAGVAPGRWLRAEGRLTVHDGRPAIFNPRYALRAPVDS